MPSSVVLRMQGYAWRSTVMFSRLFWLSLVLHRGGCLSLHAKFVALKTCMGARLVMHPSHGFFNIGQHTLLCIGLFFSWQLKHFIS